jgi:NitT/TauT family transport system permease protein
VKKYIIPSISILAIWALASLAVNRPFLPSPALAFIQCYEEMRRGSLPVHLGISLYRVAAALALAFVPAYALGVPAGLSPRIDRVVSPAMYLLYPVPKIAFLPVVLLFLGLGNLSKIFLIALIVFFQFYLNFRDEAAGISPRYFNSLFSLGGDRRDLLRHVIFPALLPRVFSSLRMALGTAIAVLFMTETFATSEGIGWYVMDAWARVSYPQMYAGIIALSFMGLLLFALLDLAQKKTCKWSL